MAAKMALADLQSAAAQFARSHGILALTQLLKEHGATKLTDVSPEGWAALHTALTEGA